MNEENKPQMVTLDTPERSRTYIYRSGFRYTLADVVAVGVERSFDRVQTADGHLHVVLTIIGSRHAVPMDWCVAKELDCDAWTF